MGSSSFTLDDDVPSLGQGEDGPQGLLRAVQEDQSNFLLLVLLYFLQGIPMGLAHGSVHFLLKNNVSYSAIGVFSLAAYLFAQTSMESDCRCSVVAKGWPQKELDFANSDHFWILDDLAWQEHKQNDEGGWRNRRRGMELHLVVVCASLPLRYSRYCRGRLGSHSPLQREPCICLTAQTVGLTAGQFLSYTVFLAFNSKDFANKWFRPLNATGETGLMELDGYLTFWGWAYLIVTFGLAIMKREDRDRMATPLRRSTKRCGES